MNDASSTGPAETGEVTTSFGTVIVSASRDARQDRAGAPRQQLPPQKLLLGVCSAVFVVLAVTMLVNLPRLLDTAQPLTAGNAVAVLVVFAVAAVGLIAAAALLPVRLVGLPVGAAAAFTGFVLAVTLIVGDRYPSFIAAVFIFSACWAIGRWILRALRVPTLAAMPPVAWLVGAAALGLFILIVGRMGVLRWWSVGLLVLGAGGFGLYRLATLARSFAPRLWAAVTESRRAAGSAALILLVLGFAAVWTAAPELMYDALYFKAWLPAEWARTGEISPLRDHAFLNVYGFSQLLATPGHLFGADGVGRYMQWLAFAFIPASLWWFLRDRTRWAPLVAAAVVITPQLFWESTTAYDDDLLVLAALAAAIAIVAVLDRPQRIPLLEGFVIGFLGGACVDFKLHLAWLALGLVLAYLLMRGSPRLRPVAGVVVGGAVAAGLPLALRWIDIGNPLFPALGGVFHSAYWASDALGSSGAATDSPVSSPLHVLWTSGARPLLVAGGLPPGALGFLGLAIVAALVLSVAILRRRRATKGPAAVAAALIFAVIGWYLEVRILRYLLPTAIVAVLIIGLAAGRGRLTAKAERASLAALAVIAVLLWPATLAQYWNVPGRTMPVLAAVGFTDAVDYERSSMPERSAFEAFDKLSRPGATMLTFAHQRTWLTDGRDLQPWWEVLNRLQLNGASLPASAREELSRIRAMGTDWVLVPDPVPRQSGYFYLQDLIARYGELRWSDDGWNLFRLTASPRTPAALPACDDNLRGTPGCWQGALDHQPGYTSRDDPRGISRTVAVCPGELLTVDIRTGGRGLERVEINFNDPFAGLGKVRPVLEGNNTARVGATAPPGATRGTVTLLPPPDGLKVAQVRLGRVGGGCPRGS
ncbi:MAG: hypothetical protein WBQ41_11140 [Solirubrobacterales bacterium]